MLRQAVAQNTPRARPQTGQLSALAIPAKGLNARDSLALMGPEYAVSLNNVLCEAYGLKTRKGYREYATNIPPLATPGTPVATVMSYHPATALPAVFGKFSDGFSDGFSKVSQTDLFRFESNMARLFTSGVIPLYTPAGKLFAARTNFIYDVTAGGAGPWVAEVGVTGAGAYWSWINFQNAAGSFLLTCNHEGGYAIYDGATWTMPTMGGGAGQIANVDPANLCFILEHKKRLWFIEKGTTKAWYLPVGQITGSATMFNFGEQFRSGGSLYALAAWTVDGGVGPDDYLVAVSSEGDIVVYKGTDPNSATDWAIVGVWHVGPLPVGRRGVFNTGADVHILSQFGLTPLSLLLKSTEIGILEQQRTSYLIGPLLSRLLRDSSRLLGWQVRTLPKEELVIVTVPVQATEHSGAIFALKYGSNAWSTLSELPYASYCNIDDQIFCGTYDGRVLSAFDGPLDNVLLGTPMLGSPIKCTVMPAFQPLGVTGAQKRIVLARPTFIATVSPAIQIQIVTDYGLPKASNVPTVPDLASSLWDVARWDIGRWTGIQSPIHEWFGCRGAGFAATLEMQYRAGGDTVLTAIDFWTEQGGVL